MHYHRLSAILLVLFPLISSSFLLQSPTTRTRIFNQPNHASHLSSSSTNTSPSKTSPLSEKVSTLKKILAREYITFFNPMYTEYYSPTVTFDDPMTTLSSVQAYQDNVDMLAGRTLMGSILFDDGGIILHSVTGGDIVDGRIEDIVTRWTLRVTAKILPWKPTARFSGISVYKVQPDSTTKEGVIIMGQTDYWDSINIKPGGTGSYQKVSVGNAVKDFLGQLQPGGLEATAAAPELPYELLRRGDGYEVRRYPAFVACRLPYTRRDEGFGSLGAFTRGMSPLSPAIMEVSADSTQNKYMSWPIVFAPPGDTSTAPAIPELAAEKAGEGQWRTITTPSLPSRVVAIADFNDASLEQVVRKADRALRADLIRDGLKAAEQTEGKVLFAQYDAIFSMGKRRGEVWIELEEGANPW